MKPTMTLLLSTLCLIGHLSVRAQDRPMKKNYIGLIPSVLAEPYDTINAIEVNALPILFERRIGENNGFGFQVRPILNYRCFGNKSGFSQMGGTLVANRYFLNVFEEGFWLKPQLGAYYTYAYNRLDKIQTMTLGIEPGAFMLIAERFSLSVNLQPGVNYYPDQFSRDFVRSESGFKAHFGIIFHIGYNF